MLRGWLPHGGAHVCGHRCVGSSGCERAGPGASEGTDTDSLTRSLVLLQDVHGSRTRGDGSLVLALPSSYDSSPSGSTVGQAAVPVVLRCTAPSCLALNGNGFLVVPSAGTLVAATPGGWAQPVAAACGGALTHTGTLGLSEFTFLWTPPTADPKTGAGGGTVTFDAVVVAAVPQVSFIVTGCVPDVGGGASSTDGSGATETSMAGMNMRHRRRLVADSSDHIYGRPPPPGPSVGVVLWSGNTTVCPASSTHARHGPTRGHMSGMMGGVLWARDPTRWSLPAVLYQARIRSTGDLILLLALTTLLGASTPVLGAWLTSKHRMRVAIAEEAAAASASGGADSSSGGKRGDLLLLLPLQSLLHLARGHATRVAGDIILVSVYEAASYGCMLLAMTFNAYVIAALSFGAGLAFLALRMA